MKKIPLLALLLLCSVFNPVTAQNEFSKWYFGYKAGLNFSTVPPTVLTNNTVTLPNGVATISDAGGNLLFYTEGSVIFNSNNVVMANGAGLNGSNASTQSAIIVKQPGNANLYYVFTTEGTAAYSIVDMSLAASLGSVTVKSATLYAGTTNMQVVVRHCNGRDAWIVNHKANSNEFRAYLLSSAGLNTTAVVSPMGQTLLGGSGVAHLKISPDGRLLAMSNSSTNVSQGSVIGGFHLFDFDAATGVVSNSLTVKGAEFGYGLEFSENGKMLYGSVLSFSNDPSKLYQWNVCASSTAAIVASVYSVNLGTTNVGDLQRAIDGKIYLTASGSQSLGVIHSPNLAGTAMNFVPNALDLGAPRLGGFGLPNFINPYTKQVPLFSSTVACQTTSFAAPAGPTFSSGCSAVPYPYSSFLWDFGEASSGAANSSTVTNPAHTYSANGTYTVTLIMYSNCTNDTVTKVINITTPNPSITVSGIFNVCNGDKRTYTASGGTTYQWSNSTTTSTVALTTTSTTVYSVTGSSGICSAKEVFTVTVNECVGLSKAGAEMPLSVFPNPFNNTLNIESTGEGKLMIFDLNGKLLLEGSYGKGVTTLETEDLIPGMYIVEMSSGAEIRRGKMLKVD